MSDFQEDLVDVRGRRKKRRKNGSAGKRAMRQQSRNYVLFALAEGTLDSKIHVMGDRGRAMRMATILAHEGYAVHVRHAVFGKTKKDISDGLKELSEYIVECLRDPDSLKFGSVKTSFIDPAELSDAWGKASETMKRLHREGKLGKGISGRKSGGQNSEPIDYDDISDMYEIEI